MINKRPSISEIPTHNNDEQAIKNVPMFGEEFIDEIKVSPVIPTVGETKNNAQHEPVQEIKNITTQPNVGAETKFTNKEEQSQQERVEEKIQYQSQSTITSGLQHETVDPVESYDDTMTIKEIDEAEDVKELFILPSSTAKKFMELYDTLEELYKGTDENPYTKEEERILAYNGVFNTKYPTPEEVYYDKINQNIDNMVNKIKYGNTTYNMRNINFKSGNVTGTQAVARFRSLLTLGEVAQIPLWHSGFWVVLKPATQTEIINLQIALARREIDLGKITNTMIYSNYGVIYNRILTDFIIDHIHSTSLKLHSNDDIREYINIQDFFILALGMLSTMYPKGVTLSRTCCNSMKLDEQGRPLCDFSISGLIDPKKLLWVDKTELKDNMINHMAKKDENIMTIDSVKEYQYGFKNIKDKTVVIKSENNNEFTVTFTLPNLKYYLVNGEQWVNDIVTKTEELFAKTDNIEQKNSKISRVMSASHLAIYNIFVKRISMGSDTVIEKIDDINEALSIISTDNVAYESFMKAIREYISTSAVAICAAPNFECPKCKMKQETKDGPFKEFIPLNVIEHFFALCALRARRTDKLV